MVYFLKIGGMPMRIAPEVVLSENEKVMLERWSRGRSTPARLVGRAKIVLLAAEGKENREIASMTGFSRPTVGMWRSRFIEERLPGIEKDAPRGGRRPTRANQLSRMILERTTQTKPKNATHWSVRTLAEELGVSPSMVHRVWKAHKLQPHRTRTFKVSNDPHFVEKVIDIVGLYLNPPERALVLCADEKSQVQALDRTQPGLPMKPGRCGTMTHDYKRNGTTSLFAAIELAEGRLIGTCMPRHRHQEWIKFLKLIDEKTPEDLDLHLVIDNYATHKHPRVKSWLKRHPRFHIHFIPTSSSWLNLIERWFRDITDKRIRRGVFRSVEELVSSINDYISEHNENPETFHWSAKANEILEKVERARNSLNKSTSE
jgi:transposase